MQGTHIGVPLPPMKRFSNLVIFFLFATNAHAQSPTGYDIMQEQERRNTGYHDEKSIARMFVIGSHGEKTEREFEFRKLEKSGAEGDGFAVPGGAKSLIKFIKPADIQRTGLLSFQNKTRDDDQWLFLPAMGKTKRISGTGKSGSFVGSEFSYEDLIPLNIDKYAYQFLKIEPCPLPLAPSLDPDRGPFRGGRGEGGGCFVVESRPKFSDSGYAKTISWIRTDHYQTVKVDFYDLKERLLKTAVFENHQLYNEKFWRPLKISMQNHQNNKQTELMTSQLGLNNGLKTSDFTQMALER